ncbi:unnamed protein product [Pylaiella littoralis]
MIIPSFHHSSSAFNIKNHLPMATLEQLTGMGFSEDAAKAALEAHGPTGGALDALLGLAPHHSTQVVSASISQYDVENGKSACTCICLEASLSILGCFGNGTWAGSPDDVANMVNVGVAMYEAVAASSSLAVEHTSVADILPTVARYGDALQPATTEGTHQGLLGTDKSIASILRDIKSARKEKNGAVAVAITKPPETVVCFLPPENQAESDARTPRQWLLFDSHPRPQQGLVGASVRSFGGEESLVEALNETFPAVDLGTNNVMASMYNMFDCVPLSLQRSSGER